MRFLPTLSSSVPTLPYPWIQSTADHVASTIENDPHIGGPVPFKPLLLKGQLGYITLLMCGIVGNMLLY